MSLLDWAKPLSRVVDLVLQTTNVKDIYIVCPKFRRLYAITCEVIDATEYSDRQKRREKKAAFIVLAKIGSDTAYHGKMWDIMRRASKEELFEEYIPLKLQ